MDETTINVGQDAAGRFCFAIPGLPGSSGILSQDVGLTSFAASAHYYKRRVAPSICHGFRCVPGECLLLSQGSAVPGWVVGRLTGTVWKRGMFIEIRCLGRQEKPFVAFANMPLRLFPSAPFH